MRHCFIRKLVNPYNAGMNTMTSKCFSLLILAMLLLPAAASADSVSNLHSASVVVADQGDGERQRGLRAALAEVMIKLSGSRSVIIEPEIKQALKDPLRYLSRFGYVIDDDDGQQRLNAEFDKQAVNDLLVNNSLPIWQAERPTVLFWLAIEKDNRRQLIGANSQPVIESMIEQHMERRGVPYFLPLLDLDDRSLVSVAEVWGGFRDVIQVASVRYSPGATVMGRLYPVSGGWRAHWTLLNADGSSDSWDSEGVDEEGLITAGIDSLADSLGRLYAARIDSTRSASTILSIGNISGVEDYAKVLDYLESLQFVDRVSVYEVRGANASFVVQYKGHLDDIRLLIERGKVLRANASAQFSFSYDTLSYSLIP